MYTIVNDAPTYVLLWGNSPWFVGHGVKKVSMLYGGSAWDHMAIHMSLEGQRWAMMESTF